MTYNFEGLVKVVLPTQEFASGFKKREIIVSSTDEKFPQDIKFEFIKDSADKLEAFKPNDMVKVVFGLKGNEYEGKFYTNLVGVAIAHLKADGTIKTPTMGEVVTKLPESDDDLPF